MATKILSMSAPVVPGAAVRAAHPANVQRYSGAIAFKAAPLTLRRSSMRGNVASLKPANTIATISRGRISSVSVTAQIPLPPKSVSYGLSAIWLAAGLANMFATNSVIDSGYASVFNPGMTLMVKQLGAGMIAIAGAMCSEAKTHSPPTAAGIILMSGFCNAFLAQSKSLMSPAIFSGSLLLNSVTFVYFLWKKYAEKKAAKLNLGADAPRVEIPSLKVNLE